jgi:tRNA uridine 5-carbamoylmethylation protein Kti12
MANNKKMTKRDYFNALLAIKEVADNSAMVDFINHELELLEKKNSAERKPTAQQTANEAVKVAILEGMENGKLYTITDMIKEIPACAEMTNQRVSALVRQMLDISIERVEEKRKAYFRKIAD